MVNNNKKTFIFLLGRIRTYDVLPRKDYNLPPLTTQHPLN